MYADYSKSKRERDMSRIGQQIASDMEKLQTESIDDVVEAYNGKVISMVEGLMEKNPMFQDGDPELWIRLEDRGDLIEIREGSFSMLITPKQAETLHFMLGTVLRERDEKSER